MNGTIVTGIDNRTDPAVVQTAGDLAMGLGSRLVLAHVVEDPPLRGSHADRERNRHAALRRGRENLSWVRGELPAQIEVHERVVLGSPAEELIAIAGDEEAELLVVGSRGLGPLGSALLGSVSRTVAREAPCPVLIMTSEAVSHRRPAAAAPSSVVAGVDGSARSHDAARLAGDLAARLGASLVLVHALDASLGMLAATEEEAADTVQGILVSIGADGEARVEWGPASHALESVAEETNARLIVLGPRDMGALRAAALGSVTSELLGHSRHPVVVVPERAGAGSGVPSDQAEHAA